MCSYIRSVSEVDETSEERGVTDLITNRVSSLLIYLFSNENNKNNTTTTVDECLQVLILSCIRENT